MQSGKLRKRFTILTYAADFNNYGENKPPSEDDDWTTFATVYGSLDAETGEEYEQGDKVNAKVTHRIKIRYLDGLLDKMRFKLGSRYFNIDRILPDRTDAKNMVIKAIEKTS